MKAARAPLRAPGLSAYLIGGGIERWRASGDRLGVVGVLHVEPAANQLSSHAGRQAPDSSEATRPMNKPVDDRDTGEMRVEPKTSLNLTLDFGVGSIACAVDLPQLASVPLLPRPLALLRFARPGEPGLAPFLLTLRPFFNVLIGWLSGHNAHPHSRFVCTPVRIRRLSHSAYCYLSAIQGYPIAGRHSSCDQPPATDELLDRLPIAARAILAGESPAPSTNCGFFSALKLDYVDDPVTPADVVNCWWTTVSDRPCPRLRR
jgi:hypothetical protein